MLDAVPRTNTNIDLRVPPLAELHARRSLKWHGYAPDVLAATVAEMDFPIAPPVAGALHAAIDRHDLGYAHARIPRLADAFAGFAARRLEWRVDSEQVRLVPDVMVGVLELARTLAGPDRSIALATPAYRPFLADLPSVGLDLREVSLRDDGAIDFDGLRSELDRGTRVFLLASPHNPTGRVLPRDELERLAGMCAERGVWVIADEIHAPLALPGAKHVPWLEVSDAARSCGIVPARRRIGCRHWPSTPGCWASWPRRWPSPRGTPGSTPSSPGSTRTGPCSAGCSPKGCPRSSGRLPRRPIWPGLTAAPSGSATIPPERSWSAATLPSRRARTTADPGSGTRG
jgi:hypothetical protein